MATRKEKIEARFDLTTGIYVRFENSRVEEMMYLSIEQAKQLKRVLDGAIGSAEFFEQREKEKREYD